MIRYHWSLEKLEQEQSGSTTYAQGPGIRKCQGLMNAHKKKHKKYKNDCGWVPSGMSKLQKSIIGHYCDVIMGGIASQITSLAIVYPTVNSHADQRKHQSSASLAFVRGIHRGPVNSPHKWPVTRKMFLFDDVIMRVSMCIFHELLKFHMVSSLWQGKPTKKKTTNWLPPYCHVY